jgi:TRAP-type C4-dicarboxylate transport system permease small subunit
MRFSRLWAGFAGATASIIRGSSALAGIILTGMMVLIIADVVMRYLFAKPIKGVFEVTEEVLMVMMVFLALAGSHHIRVTFLMERLPQKFRDITRSVLLALTLGFFAVVVWQSWAHAFFSFIKRETSWGLIPFPLYPSRFMVFIGFLFLTLRLLVDFGEHLKGKGDHYE